MKKGDIVSLCVFHRTDDHLSHYADAEVKTLTDKTLVLFLVNMRNVFLSMSSVLFNSVDTHSREKDKTVRISRKKHHMDNYSDGFVLYYNSGGKPTIILPKNTVQKVDMNASLVAVVYGG